MPRERNGRLFLISLILLGHHTEKVNYPLSLIYGYCKVIGLDHINREIIFNGRNGEKGRVEGKKTCFKNE